MFRQVLKDLVRLLSPTRLLFELRDEAVQQRDEAIRQRDEALRPSPDTKIEFGLPKENVRPEANYAPWANCEPFCSCMARINFSAVDRYRCFELWQMVEQVVGIPGDILEVGVWRGGTGMILAEAILFNKLDAKLYLCDTFCGVVNASNRDPFYRGGEFSDTSEDDVRNLFSSRQDMNFVSIHKGVFPEETGALLEGRFFRLVHIDVDVYISAKNIFEWVWKRLSIGGVIIFDDYGFVDCAGITNFVNEEIRHREDCILVHNLNGHAVIIKLR